MNASIQWAAKVAHVREVSLLGTADFAYWKERLAVDDLLPAEVDGRAQLIAISADLKYMGVRFREMSFSVAVSRPGDQFGPDAAYLLRAFNTSRAFACMERSFFSTPYFHGDVRLSTALPASIRLIEPGEVAFAVEMGTDAAAGERQPAYSGDDRWEGPVFLPRAQRQAYRSGKLFVGASMARRASIHSCLTATR